MNFPGPPNDSPGLDGWGYWRFPQSRPFHDYLNGRYQDPVFYAPNDTSQIPAEVCMDQLAEFTAHSGCNASWSSYARSPAAIFHPDVFRSNAEGGWQAAWELDHGYETPGFFQATYPNLKTHIIEHSWVQNPPAPCNPVFFGCEPYYFNAGIDSAPVTLFYDGSVRLMGVMEAMSSDRRALRQSGVAGLWSRDTPFGEEGYLIEDSYDFVETSYHILTIDGVRGRDTVGTE